MEVRYRQLFLRDLKKLKKQPVYDQVVELAFTVLPAITTLQEVSGVKAMKGFSNRYRIRLGDYRIGIELYSDSIEMVRVLHRREFYRYFP